MEQLNDSLRVWDGCGQQDFAVADVVRLSHKAQKLQMLKGEC